MAKKKKNNVLNNKKNNSSKYIFFTVIGVFVLSMILLLLLNREQEKDQVDFDLTGQPTLGEEDAPVQLVEFGDFKCPACKSFEEVIFPQLKADYIDTGKAKFTFINKAFLGPDSLYAAVVGEAVYKQNPDAFWDYYQVVYDNQGPENIEWASIEFLLELINNDVPAVDSADIEKFINEESFEDEMNKDEAIGNKAGVTGTPSLFINGIEAVDPFDYDKVKEMIDDALEGNDK